MTTDKLKYEEQWVWEFTEFTSEGEFYVFINKQTGGKLKMPVDYVSNSAAGGVVEGGRVEVLTVTDIWAAFPAITPGATAENGYLPHEVAEAQRQFASDVRIAAKRNREDAAYERIQELQ